LYAQDDSTHKKANWTRLFPNVYEIAFNVSNTEVFSSINPLIGYRLNKHEAIIGYRKEIADNGRGWNLVYRFYPDADKKVKLFFTTVYIYRRKSFYNTYTNKISLIKYNMYYMGSGLNIPIYKNLTIMNVISAGFIKRRGINYRVSLFINLSLNYAI